MEFRLNPAFEAELKRRVAAGVEAAGKEYVGAVIEEVDSAPRGGTNLNQFGRPRSAPGEPPASETGRWRGALGLNQAAYNVVTVGFDDLEVAEYAAHLERGTIRMAARPVFEPVLLQQAPYLLRAFAEGFRR